MWLLPANAIGVVPDQGPTALTKGTVGPEPLHPAKFKMGVEVIAMSYATLLLGVGLVWVTIGAVLALVMGRRGHDAFSWFVVGGVLGPLGLVLAADAWRHGEQGRPQTVSRLWSMNPGPVDVLVGFDGSPECRAALDSAIAVLGARLGRLTLATVVPYDGGRDHEELARIALEGAAAALKRWPRLEILHGRPSQALLDQAALEGYGLLVIGTKGAGASRSVLGSTATELARTARVPVLMVGPGEEPATVAERPALRSRSAPGR